MVINLNSPVSPFGPMSHITVSVVDGGVTKSTKGRPIKFDSKPVTKDHRNESGDVIKPILYETQCPFCGKRIQFVNNLKSIKCGSCNRGQDVLEVDDFVDPFCEPGDFDPVYKQNSQIAIPRAES